MHDSVCRLWMQAWTQPGIRLSALLLKMAHKTCLYWKCIYDHGTLRRVSCTEVVRLSYYWPSSLPYADALMVTVEYVFCRTPWSGASWVPDLDKSLAGRRLQGKLQHEGAKSGKLDLHLKTEVLATTKIMHDSPEEDQLKVQISPASVFGGVGDASWGRCCPWFWLGGSSEPILHVQIDLLRISYMRLRSDRQCNRLIATGYVHLLCNAYLMCSHLTYSIGDVLPLCQTVEAPLFPISLLQSLW